MDVELSYCVVNTDQRQLLNYCLDAIARERATVDFETETLVLDNASWDGSADAARSHAVTTDVLAVDRRYDRGETASALLRRARGRFCLLLNEDSELEPGATAALHGALAEAADAGAAGATLVSPDGTQQPSAWRFPSPATSLLSLVGLKRRLVVQSHGPRVRERRLGAGRGAARPPRRRRGGRLARRRRGGASAAGCTTRDGECCTCPRRGPCTTTSSNVGSMGAPVETYEQRVTPLELFFDLVFVFAITRVTALMAHDLSWASIGQGLLVLAALWWGWAAYAWLTNHVSGEDGRARVVVFVAMGAMVLVALAVPEAFDAHALLFALAYMAMRMAHLALYWVSSLEDPEVHVAVGKLLPTAITGPLLLVAASFTDGVLQTALWMLALLLDYGGPFVRGVAGYRVHPGALRRALLS